MQVPPGIRPQKRGLRLEAGRLSYTQEEREHYLQPLGFSFKCGIGPKARSQYAKLETPEHYRDAALSFSPSESGMIPPHASNVLTVNSGLVVAGFKSSIP